MAVRTGWGRGRGGWGVIDSFYGRFITNNPKNQQFKGAVPPALWAMADGHV
jgi:hypothetical protein